MKQIPTASRRLMLLAPLVAAITGCASTQDRFRFDVMSASVPASMDAAFELRISDASGAAVPGVQFLGRVVSWAATGGARFGSGPITSFGHALPDVADIEGPPGHYRLIASLPRRGYWSVAVPLILPGESQSRTAQLRVLAL